MVLRDTPQQNEIAERMNRTIMDKVRCLLAYANLDEEYWKEALMTAAYLTNLYPTSALNLTTPYEAWHKEKPNIEHLRIFGCLCFVKVKAKKYQSRSKAGLFMRYAENQRDKSSYVEDKRN